MSPEMASRKRIAEKDRQTRCSNGTLHILDSFDPILVHEAIALGRPRK